MNDRDDGAPTLGFNRVEVRAARKEHRCYMCGRTIRIGQTYWRSFMIVDGVPESMKTCTKSTQCVSWADASDDASQPRSDSDVCPPRP